MNWYGTSDVSLPVPTSHKNNPWNSCRTFIRRSTSLSSEGFAFQNRTRLPPQNRGRYYTFLINTRRWASQKPFCDSLNYPARTDRAIRPHTHTHSNLLSELSFFLLGFGIGTSSPNPQGGTPPPAPNFVSPEKNHFS